MTNAIERASGMRARLASGLSGGLLLHFGWSVRSISFGDASRFLRQHHEHCPPPVGWRFGAALWNGPTLCGVVTVGRPVARMIDHRTCVEVTRLCIRRDLPRTLTRNACSKLYGWAAKESRRRGFSKIITYTRADTESGVSLSASGWEQESRSNGGTRARASRPFRSNHNVTAKIRWARHL